MLELLESLPVPIPSVQQIVFVALAMFTAVSALIVAVSPNLFHNALALVATFFGVTGLYALLEAEFLAVSQVLIYIGAISTLITFAIMLTRGMMFGVTSPTNRQWLTVAIIVGLSFFILVGLLGHVPWPTPDPIAEVGPGEAVIANLGELFVTTYLVPFELMALLLLASLAGAILLARDH